MDDEDEDFDGCIDLGVFREISALRMFMGESRNAKSKTGFGHDNILKIRDVVTMDGFLGIVMPKLSMSLGGAIESKVLDRDRRKIRSDRDLTRAEGERERGRPRALRALLVQV